MYSNLYKEWNLPYKKNWIQEDTFIIEDNSAVICLGSIFQFGKTPMFFIEGIISNKNVKKDLRKEGLILLIDKLYKEAKEKGAEVVMTSTPRDSLKNLFQENGFLETPEKYFHLGRV
jgi:hypothetical protein